MSLTPVTHTRLHLPGVEPSVNRPVRVVARDLNASEVLRSHCHAWGQVTYALDGVVRVTVGNSTWIVPPMRAIWIPSHAVHEVATLEKARLRVLYVHESAAPFDTQRCEVLEVSSLLRELILALAAVAPESAREAKIAVLILDEVSISVTLPICVALPKDKRLKALCDAFIANPASSMTLDEWARQANASARTLARLFERELGMRFSQWRQQVRLAHAAPLIARGLPLSHVAAELGYASQSAFSAMFKKTFGQPPSVFFAHKNV